MVGPKYARPEVPELPQHRFSTTEAQAESLADVPWWGVVKDPVLQKIVREAIAGNLDLRVATARVAEARAQYGIARSFLLPQVGVGAGYSAQQASRLSEPPQGTAAAKTYQNWSFGLPVSWDIDLFGRIRSEKQAAFAAYLATEQGRRAALVALVGDVASTYLLLRELDLQLEVARRTVGTNEETVRFYDKRLQGGISNRIEVDRAAGNRARTAAVIPQLKQQLAVTENTLCFLLGRPPGPIERGEALSEHHVPPEIPVGLPAALLERRPDVLAAEQQLLAANANVGAARALIIACDTFSSPVLEPGGSVRRNRGASAEILERSAGRRWIDLALPNVAPQSLGDLDIGEMRDVETQLGVGDPYRDRASRVRAEQQLHQGRGVQHDHRASRSARMTAAARRSSRRTGRAWSRSRTSWRVGRSSALRSSRIT
jgi:hypothetical protein